MITGQSDRQAAVLLIFAVLILAAVGLLEYSQSGLRQQAERLRAQEATLKAKVESLNKRAAAIEAAQPAIRALESRLLPADKGNHYAQTLMATVAEQRASGVEFPTYGFTLSGAAGNFPRYSVAGSATGTNDQLADFIRRLEEGSYRVQIPSVSYTGEITPTGTPWAGRATVNLTLIYTAQPEKK